MSSPRRRDQSNDRLYRPRVRSRSRSPYSRDKREDRGRTRVQSTSPPRRRQSKSHSRSPSSRPRSRSPRRHRRRSSRSLSREKHKRRRSRSRSRSSSLSSRISDKDAHRKKRKDKHRKRSRSKERKSKKRDKKDKKKSKGSSSAQWGKYGILNESDLYNKEAEFRTWLVEDRMINPETMTKDATKKEFARFVEDFNTATLNHEKYYDMAKYEQRMSLLRNGETLPIPDNEYDLNADLRAHSNVHKRVSTEHESYLTKEQLQELRRVQHERIQVGKMKALGLDVKQNMGVRMDGNEFDG